MQGWVQAFFGPFGQLPPSLSAFISWFWFSDAQAEPNQKLRVLAAVFLKMQTIVCLSAFAIHMQLHTLILKWFESEQIFLFEPLFCTSTFEYFESGYDLSKSLTI